MRQDRLLLPLLNRSSRTTAFNSQFQCLSERFPASAGTE